MRRYIPKNRFQYKIWWFVTSQPFEYGIFILIMLNTVSLAMKFEGEPELYTHALDILNLIFTAVFALEFILKIMAFRFKVRTHWEAVMTLVFIFKMLLSKFKSRVLLRSFQLICITLISNINKKRKYWHLKTKIFLSDS